MEGWNTELLFVSPSVWMLGIKDSRGPASFHVTLSLRSNPVPNSFSFSSLSCRVLSQDLKALNIKTLYLLLKLIN